MKKICFQTFICRNTLIQICAEIVTMSAVSKFGINIQHPLEEKKENNVIDNTILTYP